MLLPSRGREDAHILEHGTLGAESVDFFRSVRRQFLEFSLIGQYALGRENGCTRFFLGGCGFDRQKSTEK